MLEKMPQSSEHMLSLSNTLGANSWERGPAFSRIKPGNGGLEEDALTIVCTSEGMTRGL